MSTDRVGPRRLVEFCCDNCGATHETSEQNFCAGLQEIKNEGWIVAKVDGDFQHICPECK